MNSHSPVLYSEVLSGLSIKPEGIYLDVTFGRGGHSQGILSSLNSSGRLIAFDKDPEAIAAGVTIMEQDSRLSLLKTKFSAAIEVLQSVGVRKVDGILADLGVSSPQLDSVNRGFSFQKSGPLDMRMDPQAGHSASDWLANADQDEIERVLREYGEERYARRIAREIVRTRSECPITKTSQLAAIVRRAQPSHERKKNPSTRTFQAVRIFINQEIFELSSLLKASLSILSSGGRLCIISFHSVEDRVVKRFIRNEEKPEESKEFWPLPVQKKKPRLISVGKPFKPTDCEKKVNPRSRSAILRIAERTFVS